MCMPHGVDVGVRGQTMGVSSLFCHVEVGD